MSATIPFKRLILRAVLRDVSPMVARLISVSDDTELSDLHDVFQQVLGWSGDLGYSFRIHAKEFNSFRGRTRSKPLREFRLHRQEKFLYICDLLDVWACGSGSSVSWTFKKSLRPTTENPFAWAVVVLRLRRVAVDPEAIG
jgi:hypothetical protein